MNGYFPTEIKNNNKTMTFIYYFDQCDFIQFWAYDFYSVNQVENMFFSNKNETTHLTSSVCEAF